MRKPRKKWHPSYVGVLKSLVKGGYSAFEIAAKMNFSIATIRKKGYDNNISTSQKNTNPIKAETRKTIINLKNKNKSLRFIAEQVGLKYGKVDRFLSNPF